MNWLTAHRLDQLMLGASVLHGDPGLDEHGRCDFRLTVDEVEEMCAAVVQLARLQRDNSRLRAVLTEAQECIDYGTRAGGAAEVLAHIATVLKGDGQATVLKATGVSTTTGREMAVIAAAKAWRTMRGGPHLEECNLTDPELGCTAHALVAAVDRLLEAEGNGDESWQARRTELWDEIMLAWNGHGPSRDPIAAALDRAFEFGRGMGA